MAHRKFCKTRTTTAGGGFAAANSADSLSSYQPNAIYQQETVGCIANIASSTAHYRESVTTLTTTVATLTTELADTNDKLIKTLVETTNLTATIGNLLGATTKPRSGG